MKLNHKTSTIGFLMALGAALLVGCGALPGGNSSNDPTAIPTVTSSSAAVIAEGRVVPAESTDLSFSIGGTLGELSVKEGDRVAADSPLARLDDSGVALARLASAERARLQAQQALDDLQEKAALARGQAEQEVAAALQASIEADEQLADIDTDSLQDDIDDAWLDVQDAEDDLTDAQDEMQKYDGVDPDNADRKAAEDDLEAAQDAYDEALREYNRLKNTLDSASADADAARARLDVAQIERDGMQDGPDPDRLAAAEAALRQAETEWTAAQAAVDDLTLTAPYSGTVVKTNVAAGEPIRPNQAILTIADLSQWYVETTDLTEMEVPRLDVEQPVSIAPDALPDVTLAGSIERIGQTYVKESGDILYTVRVLLAESDPRLRWGMTVEVKFGD
ncbi:MAG: efflux RND transporter periplasmic adaptor subunit [Anaerolineales bacterium]